MEEGVIVGSNNMPEFETSRSATTSRANSGTPIFLENDANAAALGEKWMGAGRDVQDLVLLTLGTGIGGGIISAVACCMDTLEWPANSDTSRSFPAAILAAAGTIGCLEKHASATAIVAMARMLQLGDDITAEQVYKLAKDGNEKAKMVFHTMGTNAGNCACDSHQHLQLPAVSAERRSAGGLGSICSSR